MSSTVSALWRLLLICAVIVLLSTLLAQVSFSPQDELGLLQSDGAVELVRPPPTPRRTPSPTAFVRPAVDPPPEPLPVGPEAEPASELPQQQQEEEEEEEDDDEPAPNKPPREKAPALPPLPELTRTQLRDAGLGLVLYVYRVVATLGVAVRTKPSPIGALQQTSTETLGKIVKSFQKGDLVVGIKLGKTHGLWLKMADYRWVPITKREVADGPFVAVMKQLKRITIPARLSEYWKELDDCAGLEEAEHLKCLDVNAVRSGVVDILRRAKLVELDAQTHVRADGDADDEEEGEEAEEQQPQQQGNAEVAEPSPNRGEAAGSANQVQGPDQLQQSSEVARPKPLPAKPVVAEDEQDENDADQTTRPGKPAPPMATDDEPPPANQEAGENDAEDAEERDQHAGMHASLSAQDQASSMLNNLKNSLASMSAALSGPALADCSNITSWARCTRLPHCAWRQLPNSEFCEHDVDPGVDESKLPAELRQDARFDFTGEKKRYFAYQPSGGWNNQRLLVENALIICRLTNRTCIAPPAAPHSNYFPNYNRLPASAVTGMPRLLNFDKLNEVAPLVAVPAGLTFERFVEKEILGQSKMSIKIIVKDVSRYKPGTVKKWAERDIMRLFGAEEADILYFANSTMWGTIEWKGSVAGWFEKRAVNLRSMPPNHMKRVAIRIADELAPYHAVHVRRGDKVGEANFKQVSHGPEWWASRIAEFNASASKVYIATDEKRRDYFNVFAAPHQLQTVFWEDLPRQALIKSYLAAFPRRMFMDVLGMLEQLLCAYADKFLGSGYSTFTTYILRLRKYRSVLAADTIFPKDTFLGLPAAVRGVKSGCDPISSLTHAKPC